MNSNIFVSMLPKEQQDEILLKVEEHLKSEGHDKKSIDEALENVKCDRLWVVEDIVDISKYLQKNQ